MFDEDLLWFLAAAQINSRIPEKGRFKVNVVVYEFALSGIKKVT